ncbi:MAG: EscU/YscU/HrcU family type III secretion system export apparatus switch protein [Gammaproteobacteria bacterium]
MAEQEQNRSEPPTPFKLEEARTQGQVAKSLDFNSFAIVCALLLALVGLGSGTFRSLAGLTSWLFAASADLAMDSPGAAAAWLGLFLRAFLAIVVPFAAIGIVFAVLANLLQTGPIFTFVPLKPKFERINPVAGFKRVFNKKMLFEAFKTIVKFAFFTSVLYVFFSGVLPALPALAVGDVGVQAEWLSASGTSLLFRMGLAMLVVALLDVAYVRWQFGNQMKMSRRELKEEIKRREGDPLIKAKLRELQRENVKQAKSMSRVPRSDVLITNPQHLAVALRYVRGEMSAPHVVAKGMEAWAADMRRIARLHDIPIVERKSLARELFRRGQLDRPVPPHTFVDVARIYVQAETQRRMRQQQVRQ